MWVLYCSVVEQEMFFQTSNWGRARINVNSAACQCMVQYSLLTSGLLNSVLLNFHPEPIQRFSSIQQLPQHAHCQVLCRKEPKQNSSRGLGKNNNVPMREGSSFNLPIFFLKTRIFAYVLYKTKQNFKSKAKQIQLQRACLSHPLFNNLKISWFQLLLL